MLPAWLQVFSFISPATYMLEGIRGSMIEGQGLLEVADTLGILALFGVIMVPMSLWAFNWAEAYAKRTGKLKRMG